MAEFTRVFALPPGIDTQRANAKFKNGVLRVVLPKTDTAKAKRIQIRAS
jgi:HSP20 family protein